MDKSLTWCTIIAMAVHPDHIRRRDELIAKGGEPSGEPRKVDVWDPATGKTEPVVITKYVKRGGPALGWSIPSEAA